MAKKFIKKPKAKLVSSDFWNKEYKNKTHLALSTNPSEDLEKFTRYLERESGRALLNPLSKVTDLGAGNGRNLVFLAKNFGLRGTGFDISAEAIKQAKELSQGLSLTYEVRSIADDLPIPDHSQNLVLDMMTSHFLNKDERTKLYSEIYRILKPGGWYFLKTFLSDEDRNVHRLLKESPAEERGSYIHPKIGVAEHSFYEDELVADLEPLFTIQKIYKSHKHIIKGKTGKRRTISLYLQK
jgi:SAM-dependent methyltransferase